MKLSGSTLLLALWTVTGSVAHAATSHSDNLSILGATPLDAFSGSSFINGVSASAGALSGGVFSDVVVDLGGHVKTTFSFSQAITAFGGLWNLTLNNTPTPGSGLRIDIGNDGSYEFDALDILPTTQNGFHGFASDTPFTQFSISYRDVFPQQETYSLSSLQFTAAVPEPETYAMLLAGLGVLSFTARRRKPA